MICGLLSCAKLNFYSYLLPVLTNAESDCCGCVQGENVDVCRWLAVVVGMVVPAGVGWQKPAVAAAAVVD